jgi:hypothetical protein
MQKVALLSILILLAGCGEIKDLGTSIEKATSAIAEQIKSGNKNWSTTNEILAGLRQDIFADEKLKKQLDAVISHAELSAKTAPKEDFDFFLSNIKDEISDLKYYWKGQTPPEREPVLKTSLNSEIKLSDKPTTLAISGWYLDTIKKEPSRVSVEIKGTNPRRVADGIDFPSDYYVTVNVSENGPLKLRDGDSSLVLLINSKVARTVQITTTQLLEEDKGLITYNCPNAGYLGQKCNFSNGKSKGTCEAVTIQFKTPFSQVPKGSAKLVSFMNRGPSAEAIKDWNPRGRPPMEPFPPEVTRTSVTLYYSSFDDSCIPERPQYESLKIDYYYHNP